MFHNSASTLTISFVSLGLEDFDFIPGILLSVFCVCVSVLAVRGSLVVRFGGCVALRVYAPVCACVFLFAWVDCGVVFMEVNTHVCRRIC